MATNEMYRQLLSQAVRNKDGSGNQYGSALLGGAMIGGLFPYKKKPKHVKGVSKAGADPAKVAYARQVLQSPAALQAAAASRAFRENYIDGKLQAAYGGRTKMAYDERAYVITQARIELHNMKLQKAKAKRENRTPQQKAAAAAKAKAYRATRPKPVKSAQQKAIDKAVNASPLVKSARQQARAALRIPGMQSPPGMPRVGFPMPSYGLESKVYVP